jgi:wyosine [tRNA(Phe)-imidazoG37] synthetase (radical SAM superfamily)
MKERGTLAFGPIPSRRLGRSLGINNIPAKTCSYSCVYCQVGKTTKITTERQVFYKPEDILKEVKRKVNEASSRNEKIDYLTFVSEGEPTLDLDLGIEISILKQIGIPMAVFTNASLIWRDDVRADLLEANLVSLKVDAIREDLWKKVNRPSKELNLNKVLEGIIEFAKEFEGAIITETMLMNEIDYGDELNGIAGVLKKLKKLDKAYIAIPTRPPTQKWVKPANKETVDKAFQIFSKKLGTNKVEYLTDYEGNDFAFTGKVEDLLSIMAVHPMRKGAVKELLKKANADWQIIENLLHKNKIVEFEYEGSTYYSQTQDWK